MAIPLVSIVMAVHNGGPYLKGCVDSILDQNFKDFELLIIDDASTDGAIDALLGPGTSRIRVHRNAVNLGQTSSLNVGLSLAKGSLVARMDADDRSYPDWLGRQVEFINSHPSCAVVSCQADVMDGHGRVYKRLRSPLGPSQIILKSFFSSPINHVGCMIRREIILAHGGYKTELRIAADFDLWSRLLRAGVQIGTNPFVGVIIRAHPSSVTAIHKGGEDVSEICGILAQNIKYFSSMDMDQGQLKKWWAFIYTPQDLSAEDFIEMDHLLGILYRGADHGRIGCDAREVRYFLNRQRKIFFLKWFFVCPAGSSQRVFAYFLRDCGFWSFYGLLWVITLGGSIGSTWSFIYNFLRKIQVFVKISKGKQGHYEK